MRLTPFIVCLALSLSGCATPPPKPVKPVDRATPETTQIEPRSGDAYLDLARQASSSVQQIELLLKASRRWQQQDSCVKTLKIAPVLQSQPLSVEQRDRLNLTKGFCLLQMDRLPLAVNALNNVSQSPQLLPKRLSLAAQVYSQQRHHWQAAQALAGLISLAPDRLEQQLPRLWQSLQFLPTEELQQKSTTGPIAPWLKLARISRKAPQELVPAVAKWQQAHPQLPLPGALAELLIQPSYQPQNIAVLLPLSGRLAAQGTALKQGILAAYFDQSGGNKPALNFLDSQQPEVTDQKLRDNAYDFVVGPLLRDDIRAHLERKAATDSLAQPDKPTPRLFLNRLSNKAQSQPHQYFYALAPEDEAEQLADYLLDHDIQRPILLSSDGDPYMRMARYFADQWQQHTQDRLQIATYSDNASMRDEVAEALAVGPSERRIDLMQRLVQGREVYNFARNRRDLDAIVIFASASETELLNPIIESNISPFARILPVYAASTSYSQQLGPNSLRDLHNLNFIAMPWILTNDQPLKQQVTKLWPQRHDGQARLFAMGYDAFTMLPRLRQLALTPGMRLEGLTGQLSIDDKGNIKRRLPHAKVTKDRVQQLDDH